jgi:uncharacterized membrane protein YcaP (DUF421 family)
MSTILRAIFAYWFLLFALRVIGRRAVMQNSPFEMILIFLFGGTMIKAVVGEDRSLVNASLVVVTIGLMHVLVAWMKLQSAAFRKVVEGTPIVMKSGDEWNQTALRRSRLHIEDIMAAARDKGVMNPEDIELAIFERSGTICVMPRKPS